MAIFPGIDSVGRALAKAGLGLYVQRLALGLYFLLSLLLRPGIPLFSS
jgi:hypothetical protein